MGKFVTLRLFVFVNFLVCLFIITLIWWSNQQQVTYANAADSDEINVNNVEIKTEPTDQLRIAYMMDLTLEEGQIEGLEQHRRRPK